MILRSSCLSQNNIASFYRSGIVYTRWKEINFTHAFGLVYLNLEILTERILLLAVYSQMCIIYEYSYLKPHPFIFQNPFFSEHRIRIHHQNLLPYHLFQVGHTKTLYIVYRENLSEHNMIKVGFSTIYIPLYIEITNLWVNINLRISGAVKGAHIINPATAFLFSWPLYVATMPKRVCVWKIQNGRCV